MAVYEIELQTVAPRRLLAARAGRSTGPLASVILTLIERVWGALRESGVTATGHNVVVYEGEGVIVAAGVEVFTQPPSHEGLTEYETPAGRVASTTHWGDYTGLRAAHTAVRDDCRRYARSLMGPNWEVYGDWTEEPAQRRTDVFYLLSET